MVNPKFDDKTQLEAMSNRLDEILNRVKNLENEIASTRIDVHEVEESVAVLRHGTSVVRQKAVEDATQKGVLHTVHLGQKLLIKIREDKRLTEQEKKLAEFLNNHFQDSKGYLELTFTEVKKDAPVDRSKINEILRSLVEKNIVLKRKTDYKTFYKMNFKAYD